ncbi:hypothetical protein CAEBREN_15521 [Caenorhabditis brenneri]|uniref:Uncharacterized protein n=1 Tax=Caenorhabditis brenneri TaxID=135651 RepID=G0N138_CAEBE|nr:hypothetical protein CAEBREN_15521 [Caenorhabditis brenneri]
MLRILLLICVFGILPDVFNNDDEDITTTPLDYRFFGTEETRMEYLITGTTPRISFRDFAHQKSLQRALEEARRRKGKYDATEETLLQSVLLCCILCYCKNKRKPNAQPPVNQKPQIPQDRKDQYRPGQYRGMSPRPAAVAIELLAQVRHIIEEQEQVDEELGEQDAQGNDAPLPGAAAVPQADGPPAHNLRSGALRNAPLPGPAAVHQARARTPPGDGAAPPGPAAVPQARAGRPQVRAQPPAAQPQRRRSERLAAAARRMNDAVQVDIDDDLL